MSFRKIIVIECDYPGCEHSMSARASTVREVRQRAALAKWRYVKGEVNPYRPPQDLCPYHVGDQK